jgi:hypothetical protein
MLDTLRHHKSLSGIKLNGSAFQVDDESAFNDVKEFVFIVVLVPVILTLHNAEPDD